MNTVRVRLGKEFDGSCNYCHSQVDVMVIEPNEGNGVIVRFCYRCLAGVREQSGKLFHFGDKKK